MDALLTYLLFLGATIAVETLVTALCTRSRLTTLTMVSANLLTHPLAWLASGLGGVCALESLVVLVEWIALRGVASLPPLEAARVALLANLASFAVGLLWWA